MGSNLHALVSQHAHADGEHCGSVVEHQILEQEVRGSKPTSGVLGHWATEQDTVLSKSTGKTQEEVALFHHDRNIVDSSFECFLYS